MRYSRGRLLLEHGVAFCALLIAAAKSEAVTIHHVDDFQDGTVRDWGGSGTANIADVGPNGVGDHALEVTAASRFVVRVGDAPSPDPMVNTAWEGDWIDAGVNQLAMDVRNPNDFDLVLWLGLAGPGGARFSGSGESYVTNTSVTVPADDLWHAVTFPVTAADLTATGSFDDPMTTLRDVTQVRIIHNPSQEFIGAPGGGTMYLDNIRAVPEPGSCGAMALAAISLLHSWRFRRRTSPGKPRQVPQRAAYGCAVLLSVMAVGFPVQLAFAANQTETLSPVILDSTFPYQISLQPYDFGTAELPTLHSFAAGQYDGKWVLLAGRTNGMHGFEKYGANNFPLESQNRDVWVVDPVSKESWKRSLLEDGSGLTRELVASLSPTNNQFYQDEDRLYMSGGYGTQRELSDGTAVNGTFDVLTAIDLPGIVDWVVGGTGTASEHIRQTRNPILKVTGGAMQGVNGRTYLVFGQDFDGNYQPGKIGTYTQQIRSFDIVDDGTTLNINNVAATEPRADHRRRDLNVFPVIRLDGAEPQEGLVALSGVFTPSFGAWTVPVEIDAAGATTMVDPADPSAFRQGMNGYHSAKLGLASESTGEMHEMLFGGISLQYLNVDTGQIETDRGFPFINDITTVVIDAEGNYSQHWSGEFPEILDADGKRLRFGSNAEFLVADGVPTFDNGVIRLDALSQPTTLGYIFGGLTANGPHTRGVVDVISAGSNQAFEVVYTPVPEPNSMLLVNVGFLSTAWAIGRLRHNALSSRSMNMNLASKGANKLGEV